MVRTTRPVTLTRNGMISSPHYLASAAGLRVLQDGGSAVDAAIAANSTLGVVYPHMTGIGGDAFWLIYDAAQRRVHALNGSGRAGAAANRTALRERGYTSIPIRGPLSVLTVPGAVDSWCAAHERFGVLPLRQLLANAIHYARDGYAACAGLADCLDEVGEMLAQYDRTRDMLLPGGRPPGNGAVLRLPELAETLETIAEKGRAGFYEGPVAAEIAASLERSGGLLTAADLAAHESTWNEPLTTTYRGYTCYQHPPNSQGFVHQMILNILEGYDVAAMGEGSAEYVHTVVEATKLAFVDRDRYLTDPEAVDIPLEDLLSKDYAAELREYIDPDQARSPAPALAGAGDTTCTVVVDSAGNACSIIQSLYHECGSGFVGGDTGVLLQNRGSFFSLEEGHVNRLEPGKRTFHTLMPGMLFRDEQPHLVYGTMGGEGQPQTSTAMVTRTVDFGQDIQRAIDQPRWLFGRRWGEESRDLRLENRFPETVVSDLRDRGHPVQVVNNWDDVMGHAQGIYLDHSNGEEVITGGADARGEGIALGW